MNQDYVFGLLRCHCEGLTITMNWCWSTQSPSRWSLQYIVNQWLFIHTMILFFLVSTILNWLLSTIVGRQKSTNRDSLKLVYPVHLGLSFHFCDVKFLSFEWMLNKAPQVSHPIFIIFYFHLLYVWLSFLSWWLTLTYISNLHFQYIY